MNAAAVEEQLHQAEVNNLKWLKYNIGNLNNIHEERALEEEAMTFLLEEEGEKAELQKS